MQSSKRQKTSDSCTEAEKKQLIFIRALKFILTYSNISLSELNWMHEDVTCIAVKFGHLEVLKYILKKQLY